MHFILQKRKRKGHTPPAPRQETAAGRDEDGTGRGRDEDATGTGRGRDEDAVCRLPLPTVRKYLYVHLYSCTTHSSNSTTLPWGLADRTQWHTFRANLSSIKASKTKNETLLPSAHKFTLYMNAALASN